MISELELKAREFAWDAHLGQKRKYTGDDYIVHPMAVANLVRSVPHTEAMICAALLHDTVEDCGVSFETLDLEFGPLIGSYVFWLTDVSKKGDGNRETRKALDRAHIAKAPKEVKTIKLADLIDNSRTITQHDPDFSVVYMREKCLLMPVLAGGDSNLYSTARHILDAYYARKKTV